MARSVEIMVAGAACRADLGLAARDPEPRAGRQVGCHIITVTHDLLKKLDCLGKSLEQYSLETVRMFHGDAVAAGFTL